MPASSKTTTKPKTKASAVKPAAAAAPAVKKSARPAAAKPVAASKPAAAKKAGAPAGSGVSPEQRRYYVEVAAYYIAERRGFDGGSELDDWVQAEQEIDRLLRDGMIGT